MISLKNDFCEGSSASSKVFASVSQSAAWRISQSLIVPFELLLLLLLLLIEYEIFSIINDELIFSIFFLEKKIVIWMKIYLLYMKTFECVGWNSALVMTSVNSSMLAGLMSTTLNDWSLMPRFHKLIRRSSEEIKVSPSELLFCFFFVLFWKYFFFQNNNNYNNNSRTISYEIFSKKNKNKNKNRPTL